MFTDEQQAVIDAMLEKQSKKLKADFNLELSEKIQGLKSTNEALKAEKLAEIEAKKQLEIEAATKANDFEKVLQLKSEEFSNQSAELQAKLQARDDKLLNNDKKLAVSGLASHMINNDPATQLMLNSMMSSKLNEDGDIVREYKGFDGSVVATDETGFIDWAGKNETMRNYLKGSQAQGGGANGSSESTSTNVDTLEACKGDRQLEAEYFNRQLQG